MTKGYSLLSILSLTDLTIQSRVFVGRSELVNTGIDTKKTNDISQFSEELVIEGDDVAHCPNLIRCQEWRNIQGRDEQN